MSDESLSKRARQKQRREAKLQQQRAEQAKSRRLRLTAYAAIAAVLAGLVGWAVYDNVQERAAFQQRQEEAAAALESLGCTEAEEQPDGGAGHFGGNELVANPPETVYTDRPATSGRHISSWVKTGTYDVRIDERLLVHNLEHGYVNVWYDDDAPADEVEQLKEDAEEFIDGSFPKLIVAPFGEELPSDANYAFTAWNFRQLCRDYDRNVLEVFLAAHHSGAGQAPEKTLPAHLSEGNGTLDPKGEDLLLPPLGDTAPPGEGMESGATEDVTEPEGSEPQATEPTETGDADETTEAPTD